MRANGVWAILTLALGAVACGEDVDSTDVKTSGVYAIMSVTATGNGQSEVSMDLRVGGANSNTHLDLKAGDQLTATVGTTTKTLGQSGYVYKTTFDAEAADTKFVVAFTRANDTSAPNSSVTLPAPFTVAGIGATVSRAEGLTATWAKSSDPMSWRLDGDCLFLKSGSMAADAGAVTLAPTDFSPLSGKETATCPAKLCLDRTRSGAVDPAYGEGGTATAVQSRCVSFSSAP